MTREQCIANHPSNYLKGTTMLKPEQYVRKPFYIDAVCVTEENMEEVAAWCKGDIRETAEQNHTSSRKYIQVRVQRPLNERQTKAFLGDWVLAAGTSFKVYTDKAFTNSFAFPEAPKMDLNEHAFIAEERSVVMPEPLEFVRTQKEELPLD